METTKTIRITGQEILEYYVSVAEDCTVAEARDVLENAKVVLNISEYGNYDKGDYKRSLKEIDIIYKTVN